MRLQAIRAAALATLAACAGCSTANWYEGVRQAELNRCQSLPESQRQACLDRAQDSWQDYERKRREATGEQTVIELLGLVVIVGGVWAFAAFKSRQIDRREREERPPEDS